MNALTQAIISVHSQPVLDSNGEAGIFQRAGAFPIADDQEYPLSPDAVRVYKSGPPFLQRYLPFWLATIADRLIVMLVPLIGILLPTLRFAPTLYAWRVRRRIIYWYRELKKVEEQVGPKPSPSEISAAMQRVDRIEEAVNRTAIPLTFANQLYDLREHLEVVRRHLTTMRESAA